jgi:Holliday junction DNA helicase RuvA
MIASVAGILESKGADRLVVQVGGVGLRLLVPATVAAGAGEVGDSVYLFTHLQVREDALTLYGFGNQDQLRLFELLIAVNGVGPAVALGILSAGDVDTIEAAIAAGNHRFFSGVPRVGPKLAQRIVLEMKAKVRQLEGVEFQAAPGPGASEADDVVAALQAIGFTSGEAYAAVRNVPPDPALSTEENIVRALRYFNRG